MEALLEQSKEIASREVGSAQLDTERATAPAVAPSASDYAAGTYTRSTTIAHLALALARAQGKISGASKDKQNPHFKSAYADLASGWEACRAALSENQLAVLQPVFADGGRVTVTTILTHSSGEWISADLTMAAGQNTPQGIGSCITYARRYALFSLVGIAPEDDDGNAASQGNGSRLGPGVGFGDERRPSTSEQVELPPERKTAAPDGFDAWVIDMEATADTGMPALMAGFNASRLEFRQRMTRTENARWEAMKAKAGKARKTA